MIFTGTIIAILTSAIIVFIKSGPDADPRIRIGAALGVILSVFIGVAGIVIEICIAVARTVLAEMRLVRRDCDHVGMRRELREVVTLQRRVIRDAVHETERKIADWPAVVPAAAGSTQPMIQRGIDDAGPRPASH